VCAERARELEMLRSCEEVPMLPPGVSSIRELGGRWWVAHTRPRFEKALARDLLARDVGYFLPQAAKCRVFRGKKRRVLIPLFPSYVFFCGDDDARAAAMRTNRICQTIDVSDQDKLLSECAAIERALAGGAELDSCRYIPVGRRCRVTGGPFVGVEGTVVRGDRRWRIVLEISSLGVGAALEVEADLLEPV
jgi:transcription antitermination factor NusG